MSALKRLGMEVNASSSGAQYSDAQRQTQQTFGFKWARRETYESEAVKTNTRRWLLERYCGNDPARIEEWLAGGRKIILDAGCGAGLTALLFFGEHLRRNDYLGIDVSDAVEVAKIRFRESGYPGDFLKIGIGELRLPEESIDIIFSEGVLHHTDSTERSLKALARMLKRRGRLLFYVYARKAAIREFTDDLVREHLSRMPDEEAWKALEPLTRLGIALGELGTEIEIPEDIPYLGIRKGRMDIQRFFYWNICKAYYRPEYSFDEMNHVNFDWFRPLNCHRHTPDEISRWCGEAWLEIERMDVQESGITVVARKA